jgi:hypothetical protein
MAVQVNHSQASEIAARMKPKENTSDEAEAKSAQRRILGGLLIAVEMMNRAIYKADGWNALMSAYGRFKGMMTDSSDASIGDIRRAVRELTKLMGRLETYKPDDEPDDGLKDGLPVPQSVMMDIVT